MTLRVDVQVRPGTLLPGIGHALQQWRDVDVERPERRPCRVADRHERIVRDDAGLDPAHRDVAVPYALPHDRVEQRRQPVAEVAQVEGADQRPPRVDRAAPVAKPVAEAVPALPGDDRLAGVPFVEQRRLRLRGMELPLQVGDAGGALVRIRGIRQLKMVAQQPALG